MIGSVVVLTTIGYGLATLGSGIGLGTSIGYTQDFITRQSEFAGKLAVNMFTSIAFVEALVLIGLVVGFLFR